MEVVVTDMIHCIAYKHRLVLIKTENIKTMSMEGDSTVAMPHNPMPVNLLWVGESALAREWQQPPSDIQDLRVT